MKNIILLLMFCLSVNAQRSIVVSNTTYELVGDMADDPYTFVYEFMYDARLRGYDYFSETGTISFNSSFPDNVGGAARICSSGFEVYLNPRYWNVEERQFERRRQLMYHEMGHALMNLGHVCHLSRDYAFTYRGRRYDGALWDDIMRAEALCGDGDYAYDVVDWGRALNRMFNPKFQSHEDCTGKKGSDIIYN